MKVTSKGNESEPWIVTPNLNELKEPIVSSGSNELHHWKVTFSQNESPNHERNI